MAKCEVCGNDYDKSFDVLFGNSRHTFDSFECAIHKLAPQCVHCSCRIIGHGVEVRLIRFRGHLSKGGYDVGHGQSEAEADSAHVHG